MGSRGFGATSGSSATDNLQVTPAYLPVQSFFAWCFRNSGATQVLMGHGVGFGASGGTFEVLFYDPTQGAYSYTRSFTGAANGKWISHTATDFNSGGWHSVGYTYDDGSPTNDCPMYLNGEQTVDRVTAPLGISNSLTGQPFFIGNEANADVGFTWNGMIGMVFRWNTLLTAGEFYGLANGNDPQHQRGGTNPWLVRPQNIVNAWPIWGQASPEPDLSGSGNNLTVNGTKAQPGPPVTMFSRMFWGPEIFIPAFGRPRSWAGVMG